MTKTKGKHPTNCAGEWRVGDILLTGEILFEIERFHDDNNGVTVIELDGRYPNAYRKDVIYLIEKEHYVNITEMQRALGRA